MTSDRVLAEQCELLEASGLFDVDWYLGRYPDAPDTYEGALRHFLTQGAAAGYDPNAFMSTTACRDGIPPMAGLNPIVKYIVYGDEADLSPFHGFDPVWYRETYPETAEELLHPLGHYLTIGRKHGCCPTAQDLARPATDCELRIITQMPPAAECVLFVTHAPEGRIKPHVPHFMDALRRQGISVVAIVVSDDLDQIQHQYLHGHCDGLILRANGGYDFAAWAHAAATLDLSGSEMVMLTNDSIVGPTDDDAFATLIARIRDSQAALVGMTDSHNRLYHYQSYLLAAKGAGVAFLCDHLSRVALLETKQQVIMLYEVRLYGAFAAAGLPCDVLFPTKSYRGNRTIHSWRDLVDEGFPFVKMASLRKARRSEWVDVFDDSAFSHALVDHSIDIAQLVALDAFDAPGAEPRRARRKGMDRLRYRFYRTLSKLCLPLAPETALRYKEIATRWQPRKARRLTSNGHVEPIAFARRDGGLRHDPTKPSVLFVTPDAKRTGVGMQPSDIVTALSDRYNVTVLALSRGEMIDAFAQRSVGVFLADRLTVEGGSYDAALSELLETARFDFAIVFSLQARAGLGALNGAALRSVLIAQELVAFGGQATALSSALEQASAIAFPSYLKRDAALRLDGIEMSPKIHVLPVDADASLAEVAARLGELGEAPLPPRVQAASNTTTLH